MEMDKRYDYQVAEREAQKRWSQNDTYAYHDDSSLPTYSIDTPPPTVSGALHIGHVFSYTHADLIARYKRMRGYNVLYPMGFDDNGLPTEKFVEKHHKTKAHLVGRSAFIKLCLEETKKVEKEFEALWRTLGLSIDWSRTYSTISEEVRRISQYSFLELLHDGHVYRKKEPALYCTTCRTSVAQAELDSTEVKTTFNTIIFATPEGEKLPIATTRPELLPACIAVFYHPEDQRYAHLHGTQAITPVFNKKVPIISDESVDPGKGTGLVMCCTFGDQTDIMWYKTHNLPFIEVVGTDGMWTNLAGPLEGRRVHDARKKVLELLRDAGALRAQDAITHTVSIHERCKQEIEYLILTQWFVHIIKNKQAFLDRGEEITWHPSFMRARYRDWVEHLAWDWCISRQRYFGIPFPVWHCKACGHVITPSHEHLPIDPHETPPPVHHCPQCKSTDIVADGDVMDTWATSALTPHINIGWPENTRLTLPMSLRPQAHDIIRTWAFYTIIKTHYHNNTIPWNDIVISGHVKAGKEKLSKSTGGGSLTPHALLDQYPADAIRYWAAHGRLGTDTAFSENQLKVGNRLLTKLWNAFRLCRDLIDDSPPPAPENLDTLSQWLLDAFTTVQQQYIAAFDAYNYTQALETIEQFFWHIFCDNYLELIKDQLFHPDQYDAATHQATRYTVYTIGRGMLQLFAPFIPHITETIYGSLFAQQNNAASIHATTFSPLSYTFPQATRALSRVIEVINLVRKIKTEHQLSLKTPITQLLIACTDEDRSVLREHERLITGITKAETIGYHTKDATTAPSLEHDEEKESIIKALIIV